MQPEEITTYILVGGQSRRFGSDKALLQIDGEPVIETLIDGLGETLAGNLFLSGPFKPQLTQIPHSHFIPDATPALGPLGGIAACLAQCATPAALFVACDMPYCGPGAASLVAKHRLEHRVSVFEGLQNRPLQPLPLLINTDLALNTARAARANNRSLIDFLRTLAPQILSPPAAATTIFHNINRPSDLPNR